MHTLSVGGGLVGIKKRMYHGIMSAVVLGIISLVISFSKGQMDWASLCFLSVAGIIFGAGILPILIRGRRNRSKV